MLCETCQNRPQCLPAALASQDQCTRLLLGRLQKCDRHRPLPPVSPIRRWLQALFVQRQ